MTNRSTNQPDRSLAIREHADGVSFSVLVVPRASRSKLVGLHAGALKVTLAAPPVDGEANAELSAVLAKALGVSKRAVQIIHGMHGKTKTVQVSGVSAEQLQALIAELSS